MKWLKNLLKMAQEHRDEAAYQRGYDFASGHLIRCNGFSDPRDYFWTKNFLDVSSCLDPFDKGVEAATLDFREIIRDETQCPRRTKFLCN